MNYCRLLPTCRAGVYERSPPTPASLPPTVYPRATVSHRDLSTAISRSFLYRFSAFLLRSLLLDNLFNPICIKTGSRCYVVVAALALLPLRPGIGIGLVLSDPDTECNSASFASLIAAHHSFASSADDARR